MSEFEGFQKIPRLSSGCVITEKIDGTNAQILIAEDCAPIGVGDGRVVPFMCGSRTRWIFPDNDNFGFARWAHDNREELLKLGPGRHFGEWWGQGIQRKYGLNEKRFSLFNVARWAPSRDKSKFPVDAPDCCHVVPVMASVPFSVGDIDRVLVILSTMGSQAAPGFMRPEGVVVWHEKSRSLFKKTLEGDGHKGKS